MLLISLLAFLSVTGAILGAAYLLTPTRLDRRIESLSDKPSSAGWEATVATLVGPFAKLSAPTGNWEDSPLRIRFINAGIRRSDARLIFFGCKTLLPLVFAFITYLMIRGTEDGLGLTLMMYLAIAALFGCYVPNLIVWLAARSRKREIFENFPDASDLMLVCVEAGLGLDAALAKVTSEMQMKSVALAEELHMTTLEIRAGGTREKALRNLALRSGLEEISAFATMLTQSDKFGTSVADSLRVFSDDLRHKRQVRAEEQAAKIPTKMLFPLVLFIFPSIIMVVLGPAAIRIIRTVGPLLN
jgi:tight adherence protein C